MSCTDRRNSHHKNMFVIKGLAQKAANLTGINQILYKTICNGITIYKFSIDWKGEKIEVIQPSRKDSSKSILPSDGERKLESSKPEKREVKK